eukprot:3933349-Rhodomonas_salina.2
MGDSSRGDMEAVCERCQVPGEVGCSSDVEKNRVGACGCDGGEEGHVQPHGAGSAPLADGCKPDGQIRHA